MKSKKATKRALLSSALSLVLCFSMLLGTTFAWFTDEANTAVNTIQSGTLKVDIVDKDDVSLDGQEMQFVVNGNTGAPVNDDDILWEPGCTFVTEGFKIVNLGNLALKYQLTINGIDGDAKLLEAIEFWITSDVDFTDKSSAQDLGTFVDDLKPASETSAEDESELYYLVGHMDETAGNEYQDLTIEGIGITVFATQMEAESDSFGNDYDEDAGYKISVASADDLKTAIQNAQDGDVIEFTADVTSDDGFMITDKNITIDLNGKTFTVSNGASTNNRNFKIDGSSVVTIKNGTMIAAGEYGSGAYGTIRTEGNANVTLTDLKLYNYRGNGLNIKALAGTTVTISNTEIYSKYGGGVESAGGTIVLDDVTVEQKGMYTAPYNSMAISVNGGGTVTVNSGTYSTECITAEEANGQGTSHGPWVVGVLNSGGTLIINGGTFSNDNYGDNSLATYARGAVLADTGANVQISGGTFNALKNVVDIQNNLGDAAKNPVVTITGGTFSSNPTNGNISDCISLAGHQAVENGDGTWTVKGYDVTSGDGLKSALADGKAVNLTNDINIGKIDLTTVTNDVVIDAAGHKITTTEAYGIEATPGKDITISNADVVMTEEGDYITYAAGFKIANGDYEGATVTLENCNISMANGDWAYAVNMPAGVKNLNLVIDNCTLEGAVAVQCWGDNNTITITDSKLICNYTTNAMYTSYCVALQNDGTSVSENNTLVIDNCEFSYSGVDNFDSTIYSVTDNGTNNTVTVTNCTYGEKVAAYGA